MDRIVMSGTKRKALKAIVQNEIEGTRARRIGINELECLQKSVIILSPKIVYYNHLFVLESCTFVPNIRSNVSYIQYSLKNHLSYIDLCL